MADSHNPPSSGLRGRNSSQSESRDSRRDGYHITQQAIFDSMPDGVAVLDSEYLIQQTNPAFDQILETSPEIVLGKHIGDVVESPHLLSALKSLEDHESIPGQVEITINKPVVRALLVNMGRLKAGNVHGWILVVHDETRRRRLEKEKAEFVRVASHELRTPLTSVMGYAQLMQGRFNAKSNLAGDTERRYLEMIVSNSAQLKDVVDELLKVANEDEVRSQHDGHDDFDLPALIDDVLTELQPHASQKNITFETNYPEAPLHMVADAALVRAALTQLVLNAINFNSTGGYVRIDVNQRNKEVVLCIQDSGIGIPKDQVERIFTPFFEADSHQETHVEGFGLGLSIVRWVVKQLGAKLTYESDPGTGTVVTLVAPLQQPTCEFEISDLRSRLEASRQQTLVYARDTLRLYRELRTTNTTLRDLNTQLDEANKLKSNFLGVISHELRSPFVGIDFALQTFSRYGLEQLAPEQRDLLEEVNKGFKDTRKMIDNLVVYAGLLSKQGRLDLGRVEISQVIAEAVTTLTPMARRRGLELETDVTPGLILPVGDKGRIGEAVWHLLHNAIKFTKSGGQVGVSAYVEREMLVISVKDTGMGIPLEQQSRIFESFSQLSDSLKRGVEGLGLGLALVRYVAAAHGGDVMVQSNPGEGSVIGFWLPMPTGEA